VIILDDHKTTLKMLDEGEFSGENVTKFLYLDVEHVINQAISSLSQKQTLLNEVLDQSYEIVLDDGASGHCLAVDADDVSDLRSELGNKLAEKSRNQNLSKRSDSGAVCYTKPLDSLKHWNDHFFWVDAFACPAIFPWHSDRNISKYPLPKSTEYSADAYVVLVAHPAPFPKFPEPFLCLIGMSRYYTLDEDSHPRFVRDDDEGGCFERAKGEPKLLEATVGCTVPLLPVAPAHSKGDGENGDTQLASDAADTTAEDVAHVLPEYLRKRNSAAVSAGEASHLAKRLREDHRALGGATAGGRSPSILKRLLTGTVLNVEVGVKLVATLPFLTSSVSATPECEDEDHTDSIVRANLRTIGAPQRLVISLNSSHHSGANVTDVEADSFSRSSVLVITSATIVTSTVDPASAAKEKTLTLLFTPPKFFASVRGMEHDKLFTEFNVGATSQMSLSAEKAAKVIRLRDQASRLESVKRSFQDEVSSSKEHNAILEEEKRVLGVKVTELEASIPGKEREITSLNALVTFVSSQNDRLVDRVREVEVFSVGFQEKVAVYDNCMK
ncbi:hypothetical protein Tco_1257416, partial [Tanacetum coccineum]